MLVLGVERATKLLGHLALTTKSYLATIRLGQSTVSDDADGEATGGGSTRDLDEPSVRAAVAALTGELRQVPSQVSAIKVGGRRAYVSARAGEHVVLAPREVTVTRFAVGALARPTADLLDIEVEVDCSTGTYVRALARDLGAALGVGGHLTTLRRTRVGPFGLDRAVTLEALAEAPEPVPISLDDAVAECFPRRDVSDEQAQVIRHGGRLAPVGLPTPYGVFDPAGHVLALFAEDEDRARPLVVLRPA